MIRNLCRLLASLRKYKGKKFFCDYCLYRFIRQDLVEQHKPHCRTSEPQKIKLTNEDNGVLYFKDVQKQLKVSIIMYADFELYLVKCDEQGLDPSVDRVALLYRSV